jgi:hypothetical protein
MRIVLDITEINGDLSMFLMELVPRFKPGMLETDQYQFYSPFSEREFDLLVEDALDEFMLGFSGLCDEERLNLEDMFDDWQVKEKS